MYIDVISPNTSSYIPKSSIVLRILKLTSIKKMDSNVKLKKQKIQIKGRHAVCYFSALTYIHAYLQQINI